MYKKTRSFLIIAASALFLFLISEIWWRADVFIGHQYLGPYGVYGILVAYIISICLIVYLIYYFTIRRKRLIQKIPKQIFFIFAMEDKQKVEKIYASIEELGYRPWISTRDLKPGQVWKDTIEKALLESQIALVFLSTHSINKEGYIKKEINLALNMMSENVKGLSPVIPIRLDNVKINIERLDHIQSLDLPNESDTSKLVETLEYYFKERDRSINT
jgi:hypothetical protein